jgi:DinB family protein
MSANVHALIERMAQAESRLVEHAAAPLPPGLSDPDPGGEERWEAGQVWAHLAEFPSYWMNQIRGILAKRDTGVSEPIPFGRVKTDPERVGAVERDRHTDPASLLRRVRESLAWVGDELRALPEEAWQARGLHPTLGEMSVQPMVERFIVGHLEEHADQLDGLARRG